MPPKNNFASHPWAARLASLMELSDDEVAALSAVPTQVIDVGSGQTILQAGDYPSRWFLVLEGFASTSKDLESGKRQIVSVHLPGDIPVLMSHVGRVLDVDVTAVNACKLASISADALLDVCRRFPRLGELLWACAVAATSVLREWVVNVGHRPATARVAHLLCEILARLEALGLAQDRSCDLPLTQVHIGQATGLSRIHVNRSCQELKRKGLLAFEHGRLVIHDWDALARLAQFSPEYLCLPDPRWIGSPRALELQA